MEWLNDNRHCGRHLSLAIWANGKLKDTISKSTYQRKLDIFKTLMATRATPLARTHVESLNRIDIEFTGIKEKKVREAWAEATRPL